MPLDLVCAGEGIYYAAPFAGFSFPTNLTIAGLVYFRFHDFIYLPVAATEDLTPGQVIVVSNLRRRYLYDLPVPGTNRRVRAVFLALIRRLSPRTLLELGSGYYPIYRRVPKSAAYATADLNPEAVSYLRSRGFTSCSFTATDTLPFLDKSMDMIVAVFVFHFHVSQSQALELRRVLSVDGILLGNVYRRTANSKEQLKEVFASAGLLVFSCPDPFDLCKENEYWCLHREGQAERAISEIRGFFESIRGICRRP